MGWNIWVGGTSPLGVGGHLDSLTGAGGDPPGALPWGWPCWGGCVSCGADPRPHTGHPGWPAGAEAGACPVVGLCACTPMSPRWPCLAAHLQESMCSHSLREPPFGDTQGWCGLVARGLTVRWQAS